MQHGGLRDVDVSPDQDIPLHRPKYPNKSASVSALAITHSPQLSA